VDSEVSIYSQLAPLFLGLCEAAHHSKRAEWSTVAHLMGARKEERREASGREECRDKIYPARAPSPITLSSNS
jgi:hypothetical protein